MLLAVHLGWERVYQLFALVSLSYPVVLWHLLKRAAPSEATTQENTRSALDASRITLGLLAFLVLYRLSDNLIGAMINPFLIQAGYALETIALYGKLCVTIGTMVGSVLGGYLMRYYGVDKMLIVFGFAHAPVHLMYILLHGADTPLLIATSVLESITSGMTMSAYIALMTQHSLGKYSTTKYSLLGSTMGFSRSTLPSISGFLVNYLGWDWFFVINSLLIFPAVLLFKLHIKGNQR